MRTFFIILSALVIQNASRAQDKQNWLDDLKLTVLEDRNHQFLLDYFHQDSVKTQQYWEEIKGGMKMIVFISLDSQELNVLNLADTFRIVLTTPVSTGAEGRDTPKGVYKIWKKMLSRPSHKYGGVMTYWNCITRDESIGIHGLDNLWYEAKLGLKASHGCVRISKSIEQEFYYLVPVETKVVIE